MARNDFAGSENAWFWEDRYANHGHGQADHVSPRLVETVQDMAIPPQPLALDIACGGGADSLWLARRGWYVVAVDIAPTAVAGVARHAEADGLSDRLRAEVHDLTRSFPAGEFDLITAQHFHTPFVIDRSAIFRRAANALRPGGILLVVDHGSTAPWSRNQDPNRHFASPSEVFAEMALESPGWTVLRADRPQREATGPSGETAIVTDNVLVVQRAGMRDDR